MAVAATQIEHQLLALINASRAAEGLNALTMELNLNQSADNHSQWMSDTRNFSHTGVNGTSSGDRILDVLDISRGDPTARWGTAENIAAHTGYDSEADSPAAQVAAIHAGFMNSPGHRANILNPDFTHIGIGIIYGPMDFSQGTFHSVVVTQNFAYTNGETNEDIPGAVVASDPALSLLGTVETDVLTGMSGDDTLAGRGGDDTLDGGAGDDFLRGGRGNDVLTDTEGDNRLNGQKGNDLIVSGSGDDRLNGGGDRDTLEAGAGDDFLKGGSRNDILEGGAGNDSLSGNRHDDDLDGGAGNDVLNGGGDNDTLNGGSGNDTLKGGRGEDVFIFTEGRDVIQDYTAGTDSIELAAALAGTDADDIIANLTSATSRGAVINLGDGNTLEINGNFTLAQLEADISFF